MLKTYHVVAEGSKIHRKLRVVSRRSPNFISLVSRSSTSAYAKIIAYKVPRTAPVPHAFDLDPEWVAMITEAKKLGLSIEDIQAFLKKPDDYKAT